MKFEPIAIVGRSCVLPGALNPAQLWESVYAGQSLLSPVPEGRWRLSRALAMGRPGAAPDRSFTDVGGYVSGFDAVFDPSGFGLPAEEIARLDPLFRWTLHGAREALRSWGHEGPAPRVGLVLGNLSFPSASMARYAEAVWRGDTDRPDARERFMSGLPALLTARALQLGVNSFAVDAACASALYAIKLACDRLHDRTADAMIAGAVNAADDLFLHVGFSALSALSPTGRSRPFHREADGLVPAEGAAFVVLQRLSDAVAAGERILGVIRGIGMSNDGRGQGLLVPSEEGQSRALLRAYESARISPGEVGLVECHATGTSVGDATEVRSMTRLYRGCEGVPIGSLKSNLGHLITVAGAAGLLKVLSALEHGIRPPTLHADQPIDALAGSPFRLLSRAERWAGPRRAAVSAFGFGGNNAHLIVEAWDGEAIPVSSTKHRARVAVVGVGARVADGESRDDFALALFSGEPHLQPREYVQVELEGLKFPPRDLEAALPQQLLSLEAAREAARGLNLPRERTGVIVGMGCDPEVGRYGMRWRLAEASNDTDWLSKARDAVVPVLDAAGVVGTMPNIPANRITSQLDLGGLGFTVSAEELSGVVALEIAARAIREGELDAAIVGAVDLSHEPVHQQALKELGVDRVPGDAAVVLALKREEDARRAGEPVLAILGEPGDSTLWTIGSDQAFDATRLFGSAHAAEGLVQVAAATLAVAHGAKPCNGENASPWPGARGAKVVARGMDGSTAAVQLSAAGSPRPLLTEPAPRLHVYSGSDAAAAVSAMRARRESANGPARLVIVAADADELACRADLAERWLAAGGPAPEGIAFHARPIQGEIGFVFGGAAAAYPGMGRELPLALPALISTLSNQAPRLVEAGAWAFDGAAPSSALDWLWGASLLSQLHVRLSLDLLGLKPAAAIGYSSGETNSLFALGAWTDPDAMIRESADGPIFTRDIAGEFAAVQRAWKRLGAEGEWASFVVSAPLAQMRAALAGEPLAHITAIHASDECAIGGEARAVQRVLARLGDGRAIPVGYPLAAHCPELEEIREAWRHLHRRETRNVAGVRFYSLAHARAYVPTSDASADALTAQALHTIDFPAVIEQAYADGVRVFVEHGPRGVCSGWIRRVLGEHDYVAVSLDMPGRSPVRQALNAAAALVAAGVPCQAETLVAELSKGAPAPRSTGRRLMVPAHRPAPKVLPRAEEAQRMEPAPKLPPVLALPASSPAPLASVDAPKPSQASPKFAPAAAQIAQLHASVTELHTKFLALQQRAVEQLTAARAAFTAGRPNAVPTPPVSTSAPAPLVALGSAPPPRLTPSPALPGPKFGRAELEVLASGRISSVFGPQFAAQDSYARQVRMPEPPLLLADRVTGIAGEPCSMGTGTIWTQTDVTDGAWYLGPDGRMPAGVMIESGQADLLLISWLGADLLNRGERVYRLLGCELTWKGPLPKPGETLTYDIHVDGHAQQGDVRLFFFHYDCHVNGEVRLSVRHGQAGFFTDAELADSAGVLWKPEDEQLDDAPLDPPAVHCEKRAFSREELEAFAAGDAARCFGPGFELASTHVRTPAPPGGRMLLFDRVTTFDSRGGPWKRGYLRAERAIAPDDWFFAGHFKNDPCMPGTLMFEGCLQAMAVHLTALGFTLERDGWRFEPALEEKYQLRCRGQVTPQSRQLVYEVFVREVHAGPEPTVFADLLCTVDGLKAFHARRVGLRLLPDWPLDTWLTKAPHAEQETRAPVASAKLGGLAGYIEPKPVAEVKGLRFDYAALLACAWGRPTRAFGDIYAKYDGPRRLARLPGPPYHFMSRITRADAEYGTMRSGGSIEVEYDVPPRSWYFAENGTPTMPFCVLLEAALQPCGWFANYVGCALNSDVDLLFRNLDGTGTLLAEIPPDAGPLTTRVKFTDISQSAGMVIVSFAVECFLAERKVYDLTTVFGYFPKEAFEDQQGLPATAAERARLAEPGDFRVDLTVRPERYCGAPLRLAGRMLLMLDRVTGYWPKGGKAGLGYLRAEKGVDPQEWFFKAHFFQDPVQPGSLGLEALVQLLQFYMLERGLSARVVEPRFEPLMLERPLTWKYRGQVVPSNRLITTELEITEIGEDSRGPYAIAEGWLWVDGKRVYHARNLGMRIVTGRAGG